MTAIACVLLPAAALPACKAKPLKQDTDFLRESGGGVAREQRDLYPLHEAPSAWEEIP